MAQSPPPFNALRAVEAASRHRSFTSAARELHITHSAVSQSIRRLEAELGAVLFQRRDGGMQPSDAALKLAQAYAAATHAVGRSLRDVSAQSPVTPLGLSMADDFHQQWFASRAARLAEAMPDAVFQRLPASPQAGPHASPPDAEILFTDKPRIADDILAQIDVFPVGDPAYLMQYPVARPRDVLSRPLVAESQFGWSSWLARFAPRADPPGVRVTPTAEMALEAIVDGGLMLGHMFSTEAAIESGQVSPLPCLARAGQKLILRSRAGASPEVLGRLSMWMKLEIGRSAAILRTRMERRPGS